MEKEKDVQEVIKDLQHIKEAMARSNSVVKFMDMDSTLKGVLLLSGLMVILFAAIFYYFILSYGTFGEIPVNIKVLLFALLAVSLALVIKLKASNLLQKARQMKAGSTFFSLAKEIYTPAFTSMMLPFFVTLALTFGGGFLLGGMVARNSEKEGE